MGSSYGGLKAISKVVLSKGLRITFSVLSLIFLLASTVLASTIITLSHYKSSDAASGDWPTYLSSSRRNGFNGNETIINPTSAPHLKKHWSYQAGGSISTNFISAQPVEANDMIYWGSWDGNEHATHLNGTQLWQKGIGYTYSPLCNSLTGVASTATIASIMLGGQVTSVVFVGGGNAQFYALNAADGSIIWDTPLGSSPENFIWSSPAVYNGSVYIGVASFGDCPLVRGKVVQLDVTNGTIQHTFATVPKSCIGGSVWGSPTIDQSTGILYVATGDEGTCSTTETLTRSLLALRTSDLSLVDSWQIPTEIQESDFGSTPTLFRANFGGVMHQLLGLANKNGMYYAFERKAISKGPVWTVQIAGIGGDCGPQCGEGSISSSAWDGTTLYVAGGQTTIHGNSCKGSLRALNPSNGHIKWEDCMKDGPVLAAVTVVPGVAVVGEGNTFVVVATSDGHSLYTYTDTHQGSNFYGAASISNGVLYIGNFDGFLYAFGT